MRDYEITTDSAEVGFLALPRSGINLPPSFPPGLQKLGDDMTVGDVGAVPGDPASGNVRWRPEQLIGHLSRQCCEKCRRHGSSHGATNKLVRAPGGNRDWNPAWTAADHNGLDWDPIVQVAGRFHYDSRILGDSGKDRFQ